MEVTQNMNAENFDIEALARTAHSPVRDYVIPGLTSWLIGGQPGPHGCVRLFSCEREHEEPITPHSHRFDFQCWVLRGWVRNRIWTKTYDSDRDADIYRSTTLRHHGEFGQYDVEPSAMHGRWRYAEWRYEAGQCYAMKAHEVHTIFFSRGARVLFFEGPTVKDESMVLEPVSGGVVIPTFRVEPWMFRSEKP